MDPERLLDIVRRTFGDEQGEHGVKIGRQARDASRLKSAYNAPASANETPEAACTEILDDREREGDA